MNGNLAGQLFRGLVFAFASGSYDLSPTSRAIVLLTNPTGSKCSLVPVQFMSSSTGEVALSLVLNPTKAGSFTLSTALNTNTSYSGGSTMTVETAFGPGANLTSGTPILSHFLTGPWTQECDYIVVSPGNSLGIQIEPLGGVWQTISISVVWTEFISSQ